MGDRGKEVREGEKEGSRERGREEWREGGKEGEERGLTHTKREETGIRTYVHTYAKRNC